MKNKFIGGIFSLLMLKSIVSCAQQTPPPGMTQGNIIDYVGCKYPSFALDGGTPPAGLVNGLPNDFFHAILPDKQVRKLRGLMIVQLKIDTLGHGCCNRIQNFTEASEEEVRALALDQIIQQGTWQYTRPKSPYKQPVAASVMLKFKFEGRSGYTADYYRMTGFKLTKPKID